MDNGMMQFYKHALQGSITDPLCVEYKNEWRACGDDKERLMKLVMRQQSIPYFITHCNQGKGLSKQYIIENFGEYLNGNRPILDADMVKGYTYGLYVAFNGILRLSMDVTAFMWCDSPSVEIETSKCPIIYVGCNTELHLFCNGYNSPRIYMFDDSKLVIDDADDTSEIVVYKYSQSSLVEQGKYCTTKNIKEFNKQLRL